MRVGLLVSLHLCISLYLCISVSLYLVYQSLGETLTVRVGVIVSLHSMSAAAKYSLYDGVYSTTPVSIVTSVVVVIQPIYFIILIVVVVVLVIVLQL